MRRSLFLLPCLGTAANVAIVWAALSGCSSGKSAGKADAGRDGVGGSTPAMGGSGGLGAGGFAAGGAGTGGAAGGGAGGGQTGGAGGMGAGGHGAGGTVAGDAGVCPPGQVFCPGCTPGTGSCGQACLGMVCPGLDASPNDVPLGLDLGSGGTRTGGAGGGGGTTRGSGGGGGAGLTGQGGATTSGGTGGAMCSRVPGDDATCSSRSYPPVAYFCHVPAQAPSSDCVPYNGIDSGDFYCCPAASVPCSDQPPTNGSACAGVQGCEYGTHPDLSCRTQATCSNGAWQVSAPPARCSGTLPPAGCPATPTGGGDCSPDGFECYYATGDYCICARCTQETPSCILTDPVIWHCLAPPAGGCPSYYPNLGSACALPANTKCRYRCDLTATCNAQGLWIDGGEQCPRCNSPDTPIATPGGNRPIASLAPGDLVYSVHHGHVSIVPIAEVRRQPVRNHHVMRLLLATGAVLEISPGHPTADGRTMRDLAAHDLLDGVGVVSATMVPYQHSHTYDILPSSDTGTYYAGGVLVGSTMAAAQRLASAPAPACAPAAAWR